MLMIRLAFLSFKNRIFTTVLTIVSIALSVGLLLSVLQLKSAAENGFTQSISQTDLVVGARTGPVQLILYTVFNMGSATNNISYKTYEEFKNHPAVQWTIPYSLGDGHRGFRVVGTDHNFYEHYRFRGNQKIAIHEGGVASGIWDVVIGSEVQKKLNYSLGQKIVVSHGVTRGEGVVHHDDKPFTVVGILKPTGTAVDQSVYVTLEGIEALHIDWADGSMPTADRMIPADQIKKEDLKVHQITAFFLRTNSRIETLGLQREINQYPEEPMLAVIPGVVLNDIWNSLGYIEKTLSLISILVVAVGLVAMLISILTNLNQRRREISILRSVGASAQQVLILLVLESTLLTFLGVLSGCIVSGSLTALLKPWLQSEFGLFIQTEMLSPLVITYLVMILIAGTLIGLIPALKGFSQSLKDGLSPKI